MASAQFDVHDKAQIKQLWEIAADIATEKGGRVGLGTAARFIVETVLGDKDLLYRVMLQLDTADIRAASSSAIPDTDKDRRKKESHRMSGESKATKR